MADDDVIDAEWDAVLARWDDPRAHTAYLELCRITNVLPRAATRYRSVLADEAKREEAEKRLEAITTLVVTMLEAQRTTEKPKPPKWLTVGAAIFFGSLVAYTLARAFGR